MTDDCKRWECELAEKHKHNDVGGVLFPHAEPLGATRDILARAKIVQWDPEMKMEPKIVGEGPIYAGPWVRWAKKRGGKP